jgi:hypothetical protein
MIDIKSFRGRVQRRSRGRGVVAGGTRAPPRGVRLRGSGSAGAEAAREGGSAGGRAVVGGDQGGGSGGARRSELRTLCSSYPFVIVRDWGSGRQMWDK